MIGLRIGAAELAEIEAGAPAVVLAPGMVLPEATPLVPLLLQDGLLARPGAAPPHSMPAPAGFRPIALLAGEAAAAGLAPLLPAGVPVIGSPGGLLGLLAAALRDARASAATAEAERDRLRRAVPPGLPRLVLDLPPAGGTALPATQPLGRPAEGLCTIALHLPVQGDAPLRVRLLAGGRLLGAWHMPAGALPPGWLELDLPEPAPPGPAEAEIEVTGAGQLSATATGCLALRAWAAGPGWTALPRHFDWAAIGLPRLTPGLPMPLPAALLQDAEVTGAAPELVALGAEAPRLLLRLAPGEEAAIRLPKLSPGPADLLRLRLVRPDGGGLSACLVATGTERAESGWREAAGEVAITLPMPPGPDIVLELRARAEGAAMLELAGLAVLSGAAGAPRPRPAQAAGAAPAIRSAITLPAPRAAAPAPRMPPAGPGGATPAIAASPAQTGFGAPGGSSFQDLKLHQHLVNGDGSYQHLDIGLAGLVSGGGLWRQVRTKLFARRGVAGIEFREMKGWPQMFDSWPGLLLDGYGPFWRLETEGTAEALAALAAPHDRAMVAALLEVLPDLAARAAATAGLPQEDVAAWAARGAALAAAVARAR